MKLHQLSLIHSVPIPRCACATGRKLKRMALAWLTSLPRTLPPTNANVIGSELFLIVLMQNSNADV